MKSWVFTTGVMRGSYTIVEDDGEQRDHIGMDLCLGIGQGDDVREVARVVLAKAIAQRTVPASFRNTLYAFEIASSTTINLEKKDLEDVRKDAKKDDIQPQPKIVSEATAIGQQCVWCGDILPPNAAGKFSHLRKHVTQMVNAELITAEDAKAIRSLKLKPNINSAFVNAKDKGIFKEKAS